MTSTVTSLALSVIGLVILVLALKDGVTFDIKLIAFILVSSCAIVCSWLARIEASIDKRGYAQ